ncbi:hypothetical protein BHM03_00035965 [Ensete ventricosum]|uniref:EF-hand domain-containing protein n=1 Tax=Ensete ventricosum TaxID=4639 RepID=A0A445MJJ8_ENSVE|nr:hypothetical protein BHM03_00035965 [Ensete ventricosum]
MEGVSGLLEEKLASLEELKQAFYVFDRNFDGFISPKELWTELCRFSGAKIYPGKGIRFVRSDSQVFLFANSKCKRYFHNRLKPAKLTWTAMSIVGATLEVIQKKRTEKPEVRDAAREAALREIKERIKKTKDEKKAKKAEIVAKTQKTQTKVGVPKGAKGPKLGGGGGKR